MLSAKTVGAMSIAADAVIGDILLRGSGGMQTAPRTEVGFVAAITLGAINDIAVAPLVEGSTKPVAQTRRHAGIVKVKRYAFDMP